MRSPSGRPLDSRFRAVPASSPRWLAGGTWTPLSSMWSGRPAPRCSTGTLSLERRTTTVVSVCLRLASARSTPGTSSGPTGCGRRCARRSGVTARRLPGRLARLPAVLLRCRHRPRPTRCTSGSTRTCSRATSGRSHCPAGGPTSGSASGEAAGSRASRTWATSRSCWPDHTSAAVLGPDSGAGGRPPGLADPGADRRHPATPRPSPVRRRRGRGHRSADRRRDRQALLTGMLAARAIDEAGPHRPADRPRRYTRAVRRALFADHRLSALLGRVMRHPAGARGAVRIAGYLTVDEQASSPAG